MLPKKSYISSNAAELLAITIITLIFVERPLQAYADPGSGLLMWQLLGAVILGAGYQARRLVRKLRNLTSSKQQQPRQAEGSSRGLFLS
jgi:hypothetical protein